MTAATALDDGAGDDEGPDEPRGSGLIVGVDVTPGVGVGVGSRSSVGRGSVGSGSGGSVGRTMGGGVGVGVGRGVGVGVGRGVGVGVGAGVGGGPTWIVTVAVLVPMSSVLNSYSNVSVPTNPSSGRYSKRPS
jgi:hypothetical protein